MWISEWTSICPVCKENAKKNSKEEFDGRSEHCIECPTCDDRYTLDDSYENDVWVAYNFRLVKGTEGWYWSVVAWDIEIGGWIYHEWGAGHFDTKEDAVAYAIEAGWEGLFKAEEVKLIVI